MYIYTCLSVCTYLVCIQEHVHICIYVCMGQLLILGVFLNCSPSYILRHVLSLNVKLTCLTSKSLGFSYLCFLSVGNIGMHCHIQVFCMSFGVSYTGFHAFIASTLPTAVFLVYSLIFYQYSLLFSAKCLLSPHQHV